MIYNYLSDSSFLSWLSLFLWQDQEKKMTVGIKEHADHHAAGLERQTTDLQSR